MLNRGLLTLLAVAACGGCAALGASQDQQYEALAVDVLERYQDQHC